LLLHYPGCTLGAAEAPSADSSRFDFRFQQRTRYETLNDQFRPGLSGSDQALALQTSVAVDAEFGSVHLIGELMDSRVQRNDDGSYVSTSIVNALEPLQTYLSWRVDDAFQQGASSTLRAGRFAMDVGRRRFVSRSNFSNAIASYSGLDWEWQGKDGRIARAYYVVPMQNLPFTRSGLLDDEQEVDHGNRDTGLWGLYYLFPRFSSRDRLELSWYSLDREVHPSNESPARDIDSAGFRMFRPSTKGGWSYEVETLFQHGKSSATAAGVTRANLRHEAAFYHAELGYAFDRPWLPALLVQYDYASGDVDPFDDHYEGFDTLFGERRFDFSPSSIYSPFARSNLTTPGVRLTFAPAPKWRSMLSYRSFKLEEARDAWSGVGWRDVTGGSGRSLGEQFEGSFTWTAIPNRLTFETGFAQLWAGRFVREVTGSQFRGDPTYFYTMLTTSF
jgi:hypothetical protein